MKKYPYTVGGSFLHWICNAVYRTHAVSRVEQCFFYHESGHKLLKLRKKKWEGKRRRCVGFNISDVFEGKIDYEDVLGQKVTFSSVGLRDKLTYCISSNTYHVIHYMSSFKSSFFGRGHFLVTYLHVLDLSLIHI